MAGHVQHVVDTAGDTEVTPVGTAHCAVAGQVNRAAHFFGEVTLLETLGVVPDGADHRRPGAFDHQHAARTVGQVVAGFVHDGGHDAGQWQRAAAGHEGCGTWQRRHHVAAGFRLPEGVDDGATLVAHVFVVPHPGLGVDGLTHRTEDAQAAQVRAVWVHGSVTFRRLDERADGRGCGVEDRAFVFLDHLPETACVREGGDAFKNDLGRTCRQRAVGNIRVARDPADVGRAPEHIFGAQVKRPVHRELGPQQITTGAVLHTLGFAGGARRVEDKQRVLGPHSHGRAFTALARNGVGERFVAPGNHVAGGGRALVHKHGFNRLTAAHGDTVVHNGFEWQLLAAAHLVVGGDDGHGTGVNDAFVQRLGREAAKHHAVGCANTGAGLHGDHTFEGHGHVDQHTVALLHACGFERVGKLAHTRQQLFVGGLGHRAVVGLKDHGGLVFDRGAHVFVQAVGRGVQFTVGKPLVERRVGLVQRLGEGFVPQHVLARQAGPEAAEVFFGLCAQRVVRVHARHTRSLDDGVRRRKHPVFNQHGFDGGRGHAHGFCLLMEYRSMESARNVGGGTYTPLTVTRLAQCTARILANKRASKIALYVKTRTHHV